MMIKQVVTLVALAAITVHAQISQLRLERIYQQQLEREYKRSILDDGEPEPLERWFNQPINHFDRANNGTFRQKYYVNADFYKPGGPVYLYNAGEAALSPRAFKGHLGELANMTSGLMVLVEHRYYGNSLPLGNLKAESMLHLTTRQALADMAHFIRTWTVPQDVKVKIPKDAKWVVVGGSYPGNLAAWMRLKYPHSVFAGYASSAPVRAKLDYYEYDLAVGDALPDKCANNIAAMVKYVDNVLESKDEAKIAELKAQFGLDGIKYHDDFASALVDIASYGVQYGQAKWLDKLCALPVIGEVQADQKPIGPLDTIKAYKGLQAEWMTTNNMTIGDYNAEVFSKKEEGAMRSWMWQICTEYGYWQTSPALHGHRALRSKLVTVEYYENLCKLSFGKYTPKHANVNLINRQYHSLNISMNRIVYTDGEYDPWRRLSLSAPEVINKPITKDAPRYIIEKGSHCTDLGAARTTDTESKKKVKKAVQQDIMRWLKTESMKMPEPGGL